MSRRQRNKETKETSNLKSLARVALGLGKGTRKKTGGKGKRSSFIKRSVPGRGAMLQAWKKGKGGRVSLKTKKKKEDERRRRWKPRREPNALEKKPNLTLLYEKRKPSGSRGKGRKS